jgi:oligoendopeptidase F
MFDSLPPDASTFKSWPWSHIQPYYDDLAAREVTASTVESWLRDWTRLLELIEESYWRLYVDRNADTTNQAASAAFDTFVEKLQPEVRIADQRLKRKLLDSGLEPDGFAIPLRNMRTDDALYREENLPLLAEEAKLSAEYENIVGGQLVEWQGEQVTVQRLFPVLMEQDRALRQSAWQKIWARRLQDRHALVTVWQKMLDVRRQLAANARLPDYRDYRWKQLYRDYTPDDCARYRAAIEEVVVPAAREINARRKARLGVETLRPWDMDVDPEGRAPLSPFAEASDLIDRVSTMFKQLDPVLSEHYELMRRNNLLDLANRPNKGPGAWCTGYSAAKHPYIHMNAVGLHDDIMTLVHEAGHGFHWMESYVLPYFQQRGLDFIPIEMMEVGSTSMEYLTAQYLPESVGGFYSTADTARARIDHLEGALLFWPYMAVVDGFQHWVYTHPGEAADPAACDAQWSDLRQRYQPDLDWTGYETELGAGWRSQLHVFEVPFYYVEYGLAQMGAVQVWRNSMADQPKAIRDYRQALSLGGTRPLADLYAAAGANLSFDAPTLRECVTLMRDTIADLEAQPTS